MGVGARKGTGRMEDEARGGEGGGGGKISTSQMAAIKARKGGAGKDKGGTTHLKYSAEVSPRGCSAVMGASHVGNWPVPQGVSTVSGSR